MQFSVKKSEVVVFTLLFVLCSALGIWQVQRALEKRAIEKRINARSSADALMLTGPVDRDPDQIEYQKIIVQGVFIPHGQLLIDNILVGGKPGYYVITPLKIAGSDWHILVNRGWVRQGATRQQLPDVPLPAGMQTVEGIVRTPSALPFVESSSQPLDMDAPFNLLLYLDLEKYARESDLKIMNFAMLQSSDNPDGLIRDWPPYRSKVAMHIGYALQWFAFAVIALIILFYLGRKRGLEAQEG